MILATVIFLIGVAMYASAGNGEWGAFAIGAVIVLFAILFCVSGSKFDRAVGNFVDYWEKNGPYRRK